MKKIFTAITFSLLFSFTVFNNKAIANTVVQTIIINPIANVQVSGAVKKPGVYKVPSGTRLVEVISKAGGLKKEAVLTDINLTTPVSDGTNIYIATKQEIQKNTQQTKLELGSTNQTNSNTNEPIEKKHKGSKNKNDKNISSKILVNLNIANEDQLTELPGVGEKLAKNIISYRAKHGKFKNINELTNLHGVGNKKFNKIKSKVTV